MLTINNWIAEIKRVIKADQKLIKLNDNMVLFEVVECLNSMGLMVGSGTSYYYLNNGGEIRANLYYSNIGLLKIYITANYNSTDHCKIKVEKIRKAENNVARIQDKEIISKLGEGVNKIFYNTYYHVYSDDKNQFEKFKKNISEIVHRIDVLNDNIEKIQDVHLEIESVKISNFKKIISANIDLTSKLKILVGMNNAGKTSFIQGILVGYQALVLLEKEDKIKYDEYGQITTKKPSAVRFDKIPFLLSNILDLFNYSARSSMSNGVPICRFNFKNNLFIEIGARLVGEVYSVYIINCSPGISRQALSEFVERSITLIPSFFNVITNEERKSPARYNSLLKSGNYNQLFRNILLDLKNKDEEENVEIDHDLGQVIKDSKFAELQRLVDEIFNIKNLDVEFSPEEDEFISATYEVADYGRIDKIDISTLGMGTLQFIQVIAQVLLGKPSIILLDEPDAHLHAKLQIEIIALFQAFAEKYNTRFIIATHSKDIINAINPHNVLILNETSNLVPVEDYENGFAGALKNLGATTEELIGINLGKRIIIVEGEDDKCYINYLCKKKGLDKECENFNLINILPLGGRKNVISNQWNKFINVEDTEFKKIAVFDRDYRPIEIQRQDAEKLRKKGFSVVEWTKKEFENYLLIPEIITEVINQEYPQSCFINTEDITKKINEEFDLTRQNIQYEYEKYIELEKKKTIEKTTNEKFEDITLNKDQQLLIRREAETYVSNQLISDVICGKDALNRIRTDFIIKSTPTKDKFIEDIISKMVEKNEIHTDIEILLNEIEKISK